MVEFLVLAKYLSPSIKPLAHAKPERNARDGISARTHHDFLHMELGIGSGQIGRVKSHDEQHLGVCPINDFAKLFRRVSDIDHARNSANFV